jgi:formylglycine-generating enzyme required for sulfatase activity
MPSTQTFSFDVMTVDEQGQVCDRQRKTAEYVREDLGNDILLDMVVIPSGAFLMGSPETEKGRRDNEGPQLEVSIPSFLMGRYPITQAQWRAVAGMPRVKLDLKPDPSYFKGDDRPVEDLSWYEAVEFCDRLSAYTGRQYRLPSEAEWEYACRAGTTTPFHFGETLTTDLANCNKRSKSKWRQETTPVDYFEVANIFGLFDMHGNVFEWVQDELPDSYEGEPTILISNSISVFEWGQNHLPTSYEGEPTEDMLMGIMDLTSQFFSFASLIKHEPHRAIRGGSWYDTPRYCRSAYRNCFPADFNCDLIGFRVVYSA